MAIARRTAHFPLQPASGEVEGFAQLGNLYTFAQNVSADTILVDCKRISWLDAYMTAGYAAVIKLLKANSNKTLSFLNLTPRVHEILEHHGLVGSRPVIIKDSVIPLTPFMPGDSKEFAQYTQDNLVRLPIPEMSDEVAEKFFEGIDELFSNAELHSLTQHGMYACGQFFPKKQLLDFTLVDLGVGFQQVINRRLGFDLSPHHAIEWAMKDKNTTRAGDIPGGLGLKILCSFVTLNKGRLTVVSHGGRWSLGRNGVTCTPMRAVFPGTAITLEINTADTQTYYMK